MSAYWQSEGPPTGGREKDRHIVSGGGPVHIHHSGAMEKPIDVGMGSHIEGHPMIKSSGRE